MRRLVASLLFGATACLPLGPAHAAVHALLVGINDYSEPHALASPRRDVELMRRLLTETYGWPAGQIHVLLDSDVTRARLETEFRNRLVAPAGPGDTVVFYFSGHGTFVLDEDGDEVDGTDEALVLYGAAPRPPIAREAQLLDDDLGAWLRQLRTDRVFVIIDACHSGTITRGTSAPPPRAQPKFFDLGYRRAETRGVAGEQVVSGFRADAKRTGPGTVVLTASRSDQLSWATTDGPSLFTERLAAWLARNHAARAAEFTRELVPDVENIALTRFGLVQTPQVEGKWEATLQAPEGATAETGRPVAPAPAAYTLPPPPPAESSTGLQVSITASQQRYRFGEKVEVTVNVSQDAHVQLFHTGADGQTQLIFPNAYQRDDRVPANRAMTFPASSAPFQFTVSPPAGTERITVYASPEPLPAVPGTKQGGGVFVAHDDLHPSSAHLRGLRVEAAGTKTAPIVSAGVDYYVEP